MRYIHIYTFIECLLSARHWELRGFQAVIGEILSNFLKDQGETADDERLLSTAMLPHGFSYECFREAGEGIH